MRPNHNFIVVLFLLLPSDGSLTSQGVMAEQGHGLLFYGEAFLSGFLRAVGGKQGRKGSGKRARGKEGLKKSG